MAKWNVGEKNGFWRGGRSIASNGYVLIRVGKDHHLADVRGYAYEHRLVAEQALGRRLHPGEIVHHVNGDKSDNRPENLEIVGSAAHHRYYHRSPQELQRKRHPDEANLLIQCACGCGAEFPKYDDSNRPRLYVTGHNPGPRPLQDAILAALGAGPLHREQIAQRCGCPLRVVATALSRLRHTGEAAPIGKGFWKRVAVPS
jgi:hypothetical protein